MDVNAATQQSLRSKAPALVDLALTLPVFLVYQFGVVFMNVHNAADPVTGILLHLAEGNRAVYMLETASIGVVFAGIFAWLGRGEAFRASKLAQVFFEGVLYAILMRFVAGYVVGQLFAGPRPTDNVTVAQAIVLSSGAGFYEEVAFRVILFGLGAKLLVRLFTRERLAIVGQQGSVARPTFKGFLVATAWAFVAAALFSGVHYIGALGDPFQLTSFLFRFVLGLVLSLIFVLRGFACAVWAHALYDIWVMAF